MVWLHESLTLKPFSKSHIFRNQGTYLPNESSYHCTIIWLYKSNTFKSSAPSYLPRPNPRIIAPSSSCTSDALVSPSVGLSHIQILISLHHHPAARVTHFIPSVGLSGTNPRIIAPSLGCTSHAFHTISWPHSHTNPRIIVPSFGCTSHALSLYHCIIICLHES